MSDELIKLILEDRSIFFSRFHSEDTQVRFLSNETRVLDLIERNIAANILTNLGSYMNVTPPRAFTVFTNDLEPVIVAPTQLELTESLLHVTEPPPGNCSICQEDFVSAATTARMRNCGHAFHRDCARVWYSRSVFCPVCRNDIRTTA